MPPGSGLDVSIWGRADNDFGDIEIIEYQGVRGRNLYPLARPKALGVLHISYIVSDATELRTRLPYFVLRPRVTPNTSPLGSSMSSPYRKKRESCSS